MRVQPYFSICVPTYEMYGRGAEFLDQLLQTVADQTFTDLEVIISDHSLDSEVEHLCERWKIRLAIAYLRCSENRGNASVNMNNAIQRASGAVIKPMHQDDFFLKRTALGLIAEVQREEKALWGACGFAHTTSFDGDRFRYLVPRYSDDLIYARNTIGAPSVVFFERRLDAYFDQELIWMNDAELYFRLHGEHGPPTIIPDALVCIRQGEHQVTYTDVDSALREREREYSLRKFGLPLKSDSTERGASPLRRLARSLPPKARTSLRSLYERRRSFPAVWFKPTFRDDPLTRLANVHRSDKGTQKAFPWEGDRHSYTPVYHSYFKDLRKSSTTLLEIGIGSGPSLKMWYQYFRRGRIFAIDLLDHSDKDNDRVTTLVADQSNRSDLARALQRIDSEIDLIVDDGGHYMHQQQISLGYLFPSVKPGGLYIIEDLHTSHWPYNGHTAVYNDEPIDINRDRGNTTLRMVQEFIALGRIESEYLSDEEIEYLNHHIESCTLVDTVENSYGPNHLAVFRKK